MLRTITVCEKNVHVEAPRVLTLVAATATELFSNEIGSRQIGGETFSREVQNNTGNDLYISFGLAGAAGIPSCDNLANYHILIADAQVYSVPDCTRVCGYSVAGGKVSCVRRYRADMANVN